MADTARSVALALIRRFEGCRLTAYQDGAGVWTIGYGHTVGVKAGDSITQTQAEEFLLVDLDGVDDAVTRAEVAYACKFSVFQRAALLSFTFNLGVRSLRQLLAHGQDAATISTQMEHWVHVAGQVSTGLVRRRAVEAFLYTLEDA